jgi:hypothetical protein
MAINKRDGNTVNELHVGWNKVTYELKSGDGSCAGTYLEEDRRVEHIFYFKMWF